MSLYATGRMRTVTVSGTLAGIVRATFIPPLPFGSPSVKSALATMLIQYTNQFVRVDGLNLGGHQYQVVLTVQAGVGFQDTDSVSKTITDPDPEFNNDLAGSWSMVFPVEEMIRVDEHALIGGMPSYGGPEAIDGFTRSVQFEEWVREGQDVVVSASCAGLSATATFAVTAGNTFQLPYLSGVTATCRAEGYDARVSTTYLWQGVSVGANSFSAADSNHSIAASGGVSITALSTSQYGADTHDTSCSFGAKPSKSYSLAGVIRAMEHPFPGAVNLQVDRFLGGLAQPVTSDANGLFADSYTQREFSASGAFDSVAVNPVGWASVSEWTPLKLYVANSWLSGLGEDATDWRIQMRGRAYDCMTVTQAASVTHDDGSSAANWSNLANTVISVAAGAINIVVSGGVGRARRTFTTAKSFAGYRYLRLRIRSVGSANQPLRVTIGAKQWDTTTGADGTWVDRDLDTCCATNTAVETDDKDTRWPIPTVDGPLWGVTNVSTLDIEQLTDGATYEIDIIQQVRTSLSHITFLPAYLMFEPSGMDDSAYRRFVLGETDERQSLEELDFYKTTDPISGDVTYTERNITELIGDINATDAGVVRNPGWAATAAGSFPDTFHTNANPATWAFGGGSVYVSGAWDHSFYDDVSGAGLTVKAQPLWDIVDWYPEIGDGFYYSGGAYGGALPVQAAKTMRGQDHGLVFGTDNLPKPNIHVVVTEAGSGAFAGDSTSDSLGIHKSALPYGKGQVSHLVTAEIGSPPYPYVTWIAADWHSRKKHRSCFRKGAGSGDWIDYDRTRNGRQVRVFVRGQLTSIGAPTFAYKFDETGIPYANCVGGASPLHELGGGAKVASYLGFGMDLDGVNDSPRATDTSAWDVHDNSFMVGAVVKFDDVTSQGFILQNWQSAGPNKRYHLQVISGQLIFGVSNDGLASAGAGDTVTSTVGVTTGVWYLIFAWYDHPGQTLNIQICTPAIPPSSGTIVSAAHTTGVGKAGAGHTVCVGSLEGTLSFLDGIVDFVFGNNTLFYSAAERLELWNGGAYREFCTARTAGTIIIGFALDPTGASWSELDTGLVGTRPMVAYDKRANAQRIYLFYERGSDSALVWHYSTDEGVTWSVATIIAAAGTYQDFVILRQGIQCYYWLNGAAIEGKIIDGLGNTIVSTFTAIASGVDDTAIAVGEHYVQDGLQYVVLTYWSGGQLTQKLSTDGVTFS